jgi:hypothetical protein
MTTIELKSNFHKLIDNINNDNVLSRFYYLLLQANIMNENSLWLRLSKEEREELLSVENDCNDNSNLISHSDMINKHLKWL